MSKSVLGDLPEGVTAAMFLRDGWPDAIVCKVLMTSGCVGIGVYRPKPGCRPISPEFADQAAMLDAINHVSAEPPDYSDIHDHVRKMVEVARSKVEELSKPVGRMLTPEDDANDLQAALGQKAHG